MSSSLVAGCPIGGGGNKPNVMSASTIVIADAVEGSHILTIHGYSRQKEANSLQSGMFHIGGHCWYITYGDRVINADWISMYLTLIQTRTIHALVNIHLRFSLLDHAGEVVPSHVWAGDFKFTCYSISGFPYFIERKVLEESPYLKEDCFRVRCDVTVKNPGDTYARKLIAVPPSDIHRDMGGLLSSQEAVDVTFEVDGETFGAHKLVLAARSSVFRAQLFGPMKEKDMMSCIRIDDMVPKVFEAMLYFIYNDALPEIDTSDMTVMAQHLLVAADRYGLERLKLICEDKLSYNINTSTLATTLTLAEQHGCQGLKEACFEFLKTTGNLKAVMESDGYKHLKSSYPSFPMELVAKLFPSLFA